MRRHKTRKRFEYHLLNMINLLLDSEVDCWHKYGNTNQGVQLGTGYRLSA